MKKLLTFALTGALLTGCLYDYNSNKPLTGQIPSTDKTKLEGTKLSSVETEFVFFNSDSSVFEVEVENGRAERPDRDDYAVLKPIKAITYTSTNRTDGNDQNAWIVSKLDGEGEQEYEAYWLYKEDILYITEGDHESEVEEQMKRVMDNLREGNDTERYLLSTKEAAPTQN